ncbi:MAG TPA: aminoacyl-tRNA hydrolase [Puia sp.]|nr:aminoacyl-tRNA hydrolase [Puia sp.]
MATKFLIAGLGNVGAEYAGTRHNIGWDILDALAAKYKQFFVAERLAEKVEIRLRGNVLVGIKPTTFMNLSGRAVKYWMDKENISLERILVIMDDLALPLSRLRLRPGGSDAGHNGLTSIQESLGTSSYPRLRFGVGNNFPRGRQVEYVLGKWSPEELPLVRMKIEKSVELIESFVSIGIDRTMNLYNNLEFEL